MESFFTWCSLPKLEGALWCCATFTGRGSVNKKQSISVSRFPANESLRRTGLHCLFWQNPVFTFLHLISPVHVVHPLRNKQTSKLGGQHKMYQSSTVLDVARQPLWRYVKGRHRNCDDTCSFATEISPLRVSKKYLRWCRRSRRIEWNPSIPPSFLAGQYL